MNHTKNIKFTDSYTNGLSDKFSGSSPIDFNSKKIKFTGDTAENLAYQPPTIKNSFYQICQIKNSEKLYPVRKVIYNGNYEIVHVFEKTYDAKTIKKFLKSNSTNKYKMFPVNDLSLLALPNGSDFMGSHSDLTGKDMKPQWDNMMCNDEYNEYAYIGMQNVHTMASPGGDISIQRRRVGSAPKEFYDGAPTDDNLFQINNNLIGKTSRHGRI
jgi:hypothetical protein